MQGAEILFADDILRQGFWQVTLDSANGGGKQALSNVQAVIDTGTSLIVAPQQDVVRFYQSIPGAKDASGTIGQGFFTCELNFVKVDGIKAVLSAFLPSPL
jgi:cathepsin D